MDDNHGDYVGEYYGLKSTLAQLDIFIRTRLNSNVESLSQRPTICEEHGRVMTCDLE